MPPSAGHKPLP